MDRAELRAQALKMRDVNDLHHLLNVVKQAALGEKAYPFKLRQITYYFDPTRTSAKRYTNFTIPKKSGGKRVISAPVAGLKSILTHLNTILQAIYEPSKPVMGFTPGRSVIDNASMHLGQHYVYNIDLEDFFPSVDKSRVWKRLTLKPFNFSSDLANAIAGLCTMRVEEGDNVRYVLPQGAPTSPTLTNIICEKLDRQLGKLASKYGLRYSRYADDITFSSMHYVYSPKGSFLRELHNIIAGNRFKINEKKRRLQRVGERCEVTGLVLSQKVNVVRRYVDEVRTLLHIWERYGHLAACESFMRARKGAQKHRRKGGMPSLLAVLRGKLEYLRMVKGDDDRVYVALVGRLSHLLASTRSEVVYLNGDRKNALTYLDTFNRQEFEQQLNTRIEYRSDAEPTLFFRLGDEVRPITVSQNIDVARLFESGDEAVGLWNRCQISLCNNGTTLFYLLHKKLATSKRGKMAKSQLEQLQAELSSLIDSESFIDVLGHRSPSATTSEATDAAHDDNVVEFSFTLESIENSGCDET